jgi:L-asparaginase
VHRALAEALDGARAAGVPVWITTRCAGGALVAPPGSAPGPAAAMSPWQARLALQLQLLADRR